MKRCTAVKLAHGCMEPEAFAFVHSDTHTPQIQVSARDEINVFAPVVAASARHICQDDQAFHPLHNKSIDAAQTFAA